MSSKSSGGWFVYTCLKPAAHGDNLNIRRTIKGKNRGPDSTRFPHRAAGEEPGWNPEFWQTTGVPSLEILVRTVMRLPMVTLAHKASVFSARTYQKVPIGHCSLWPSNASPWVWVGKARVRTAGLRDVPSSLDHRWQGELNAYITLSSPLSPEREQ